MAYRKKLLTAEIKEEIYSAYCNGKNRVKIMRKFRIPYLQFTQILRDMITKENEEKLPKQKLLWVGRNNGGWKVI